MSTITLFVYDKEQNSYDYTKISVEVDSNSMMSIQDLQKCYATASRYSIEPGVWKHPKNYNVHQYYAIDIRRGEKHIHVPRDKIEQNESIILKNGDLIHMYLVRY